MRGRKPLPDAVKRLRGEKRKSRFNSRAPKPPPEKSDCPKTLTGQARKEWDRIVPTLKKMGIFTTVDRSAMISYCRTFGNLTAYEKLCDDVGPERAIEKGYHKAAMALRSQMLKFAVEFGFTPSSRSRIRTPEPPPDPAGAEPEKTRDEFDEFLRMNRGDEEQPDA